MIRVIPLALAGVFAAMPVYAQDAAQPATVPARPSTVIPAAPTGMETIPVSPTHAGKSAVTVVPSTSSDLPKGYPRDAITGKPLGGADEDQKPEKESLRDRIRDRMRE